MSKLSRAMRVAFALAGMACVASSQSGPRFEVASIKPAAAGSNIPLGLRMDKAQATFGGISLSALISYAYGVKLAHITGPEWLTTQKFNIAAKLPEGASAARVPEMTQALLAERFALKIRRESKEFVVYALVAARNGMKLLPKPEDFDPKAYPDHIAIPILSLTLILEQMLDMPVVDETGLQGQYLVSRQAIQQATAARTPDLVDSAIAALLPPAGMKLEKKKAQLPVIIVESMRQLPTDN